MQNNTFYCFVPECHIARTHLILFFDLWYFRTFYNVRLFRS